MEQAQQEMTVNIDGEVYRLADIPDAGRMAISKLKNIQEKQAELEFNRVQLDMSRTGFMAALKEAIKDVDCLPKEEPVTKDPEEA